MVPGQEEVPISKEGEEKVSISQEKPQPKERGAREREAEVPTQLQPGKVSVLRQEEVPISKER